MHVYKKGGIKKPHFKSMPGTGRKVEAWTKCLYKELFELFNQLCNAGVKISPTLLKSLAAYLLGKCYNPIYNALFLPNYGTSILGKIKALWVQ